MNGWMPPDLANRNEPHGVHVKATTLGDERVAIVEVVTGEPLQYVTSQSNVKKLVERWDAVLDAAIAKVRT